MTNAAFCAEVGELRAFSGSEGHELSYDLQGGGKFGHGGTETRKAAGTGAEGMIVIHVQLSAMIGGCGSQAFVVLDLRGDARDSDLEVSSKETT